MYEIANIRHLAAHPVTPPLIIHSFKLFLLQIQIGSITPSDPENSKCYRSEESSNDWMETKAATKHWMSREHCCVIPVKKSSNMDYWITSLLLLLNIKLNTGEASLSFLRIINNLRAVNNDCHLLLLLSPHLHSHHLKNLPPFLLLIWILFLPPLDALITFQGSLSLAPPSIPSLTLTHQCSLFPLPPSALLWHFL